MKRIYHNHNLREDWKQGMYNTSCLNEQKKIEACIFLLGTQTLFYKYAKEVTIKWKYSCEHFLTDRGRNRNAYLGQATCCYYCGSPEYLTKKAWNILTKKKQEKANETAEKIIKEYLKELENINQLKLFI